MCRCAFTAWCLHPSRICHHGEHAESSFGWIAQQPVMNLDLPETAAKTRSKETNTRNACSVQASNIITDSPAAEYGCARKLGLCSNDG